MDEFPNISSRFDVDDIRAVRDYNSMRHLKMTPQEIIEDTRAGAEKILKLINEKRMLRV